MEPHSTPLKDLTFVCFDTETTGLLPEQDRVVEIAAVSFRLDGQVLGEYQSLIHQTRPIPEAVTRIHGITQEMCAGAPSEGAALVGFTYLATAQRPTVLVAHNAPFDLGFVGWGLRRVGWPLPTIPALDTVGIAKAMFPFSKLQTIAQRLGINPGDAHRALSDARTAMYFLLYVMRDCDPNDTLIDIPGAQLFTFNSVLNPPQADRQEMLL